MPTESNLITQSNPNTQDNENNPFPIEHWLAEGGSLFPAQKQFMTLPENNTPQLDICLYQGGYGCGKTHAAVLLGIELAARQPHSTGLVVAKHLATLRDAVMPMYQKILTQLGFEAGVDYKIKLTKRCITFVNGSQILFRPVGRSKAYKSLECQWMHAEELGELSEDIFQFLLTRLRQPAQTGEENHCLRFFGTTTPVDGWINDYFANTPHCRRVIGKTSDNTVISPAYEAMLRATLPADQHASMLEGNKTPQDDPHTMTLNTPENTLAKAEHAVRFKGLIQQLGRQLPLYKTAKDKHQARL